MDYETINLYAPTEIILVTSLNLAHLNGHKTKIKHLNSSKEYIPKNTSKNKSQN